MLAKDVHYKNKNDIEVTGMKIYAGGGSVGS
jgi:hypothetical protein